MKKLMIFLIALIPVLLIFTVQLSTSYVERTQYVAVTNVAFSEKQVEIDKDTDAPVVMDFPVKVYPLAATNKEVVYSSSNDSIAIVDENGKITFLDFGTVTITAQSTTISSAKDSCTFFVTDDKAHRVEITNKTDSIIKGESFYIHSVITPNEALDKNITYSSSDTNIARVSLDGKVTALNGGVTTITVSTVNGKTDSFKLKVLVPVTGVQVKDNQKSLLTGLMNCKFPEVVISPSDATNKKVMYSSSDVETAVIDTFGNIIFLKRGSVIFTATTEDGGYTCSYTVNFTDGFIVSATLNKNHEKLFLDYDIDNNIIDLDISYSPIDADFSNLTFVSSNESCIKVEGQMLVIVGGGKSIITIKADTGTGFITMQSEIFISQDVEKIRAEGVLIDNNTYKAVYEVYPSTHTENIEFELSNDLATVNSEGVVTFKAPGVTYLTIKSSRTLVQKTIKLIYKPTDVTFYEISENNQRINVNYGDKFGLFFGDYFDIGKYSFAFNNSYLSFDNNYTFTAIRGGNASVTVSGGTTIFNVNINIIRHAEEIIYDINGENIDSLLTSKNSVKLNVSLLPTDTTNKTVLYSSSNEDIASVAFDGTVTFKKAGKVIITISSGNLVGDKAKKVEIESTMGKIKSIEEFTIIDDNLDFEQDKVLDYVIKALPLDLTNEEVLSLINVGIEGTSVIFNQNQFLVKGGGNSKITVNSENTNSITKNVFVNRYISEIVVEDVTITNPVYNIVYSVIPSDHTESVNITLGKGAGLVNLNSSILSFKSAGSVELNFISSNQNEPVSKTIVVTYDKPTTADIYNITSDMQTRNIIVDYGDSFEFRYDIDLDMGVTTYSNFSDESILSLENGVFNTLKGGMVTFTASGDSGDITISIKVTRFAEDLTFKVNGEAKNDLLTSKETAKIDVTLAPIDITEKNIAFAVSDNNIASIDENGLVTFKQKGKVTILISSGYVSGVNVTIESTMGTIKDIEEFKLSNTDFEYEENKKIDYTIKASPYDLTNEEVLNLISLSVVGSSVNINDKEILIVGGGSSIVILGALGTSKTLSATVNVSRLVDEIISENATVTTNEYIINYSVIPNDHTENISYSLSSNIATIENGKVLFSMPGSVDLTISSETKEKTVTIIYKPTDVVFTDINSDNQAINVVYGDKFGLFFDLELQLGLVSFDFDDQYLSFDNNYTFTANKGGTTFIAVSNGIKTINVQVNIIRYAEDLDFKINNQEISEFTTSLSEVNLIVTLSPVDTTVTDVNFVSSDLSIAEVSEAGVVTFKKAGVVNIEITSSEVSKTATITSTFGLPSNFDIGNGDLTFVITDYETTLPSSQISINSLAPSDYVLDLSDFSFNSSMNTVATVDSQGIVTAVGGGDAIISVSCNGVVKTFNVHVSIKTSRVNITFGGNDLESCKIVGNTLSLGATVYPADADLKTVTYSSSDASIATVDNQGIVTFLTAGEVVITVTTNDTGVTDTVTITKISSAESLTIMYQEVAVTDTALEIEPGNNQNINLFVVPYVYGLLDEENWDYSLIEFTIQDEEGLVSTVTKYNNGEFSVARNISINKKLRTTITFSFGACSSSITLIYKNLQSLEMELKNSEDVNFGLEEKRVFGTHRLVDGVESYTLPVNYSRVPSNNQDKLYWFSSDPSVATVDENGIITIAQIYFLDERIITITVSDDPEGDRKENVNKVSYTYTFVYGMNVYDQEDYVWTWNNHRTAVLHTTLGTAEDKVDGKNWCEFNDTTIKAELRTIIYGNGYTMNFHNISFTNKSTSLLKGTYYYDGSYCDIHNLTLKGNNYDADKSSYVNQHVFASGNKLSYCIFENYNYLFSSNDGFSATNCIFRHFLVEGWQLGWDTGANDAQVYLHNTIFYDVGMTCFELQAGDIHITGFFDVYNYVKPSEFGTAYEASVKSAYQTSELAPYIYKDGTNASNWRCNSVILILPKEVKNNAQPRLEKETIHLNDETEGVEYGVTTCTGSTKLLFITVKITIHITASIVEGSRIQPDTNPEENLDKVRRTYAG